MDCVYAVHLDYTECHVVETVAPTRAELRGRALEIVETGFEFNLSEEAILERLQKKLNVSFSVAQEYLNTYRK